MTNTFFWHDYETFGITPKSDRPAQFAGIRTDMDLNEVGKPLMFHCKPELSRIPSLESCLLTGITPSYCERNGLSENEFATKIEQELATPGTIGVGYNSIRFDDEVTRFLFWRNLIDPYAREWQNNCSRWDLLNVVRSMYAFFPDSLQWPQDEDGSICFKLAKLCIANGLRHSNAHDALSDVYVTIDLARLMKKAQPKFFDFCLNLRDKHFVKSQLSLEAKSPVLHVSSMYGLERSCLALVWPLAMHPTNTKNEIIVWDLSANPSILEGLESSEIKKRLFTKNNELPNNAPRLPIKTISINKSPFVLSDLRVLKPARAAQLKIDLDLIHRHAEIAKKLQLSPTIWQDVYQREQMECDIDEDLYNGGFLPNNDKYLLNRLRSMNGAQLSIEKPRFEDRRLNELFFRYRARNFFNSLNTEEQLRWKLFCNNKIETQRNTFLDEFSSLEKNATEKEKIIMDDIQSWIEQKHL